MTTQADLRSDETKFWHGEIAKAEARERERCAKIALAFEAAHGRQAINAAARRDWVGDDKHSLASSVSGDIAAAIRAGSVQPLGTED